VPGVYFAVFAAGIHHLFFVKEAESPNNLLIMSAREIHPRICVQLPCRSILGEMDEAE